MISPARASKKRKNSEEQAQNESRLKSRRKYSPEKEPKPLGETQMLEEARLEKLVFGEASFLRCSNDDAHFESKEMEELDSGLDEEDDLECTGAETEGVMDTAMSPEEKVLRKGSSGRKKRQPAWQDDEDLSTRTEDYDDESFSSRPLPRKNAGLVTPNLMWARLNRNQRARSSHHEGTSDSEDSDDEQSGDSDDGDILRHCGDLLQGRRTVASMRLSSRDGSVPAGAIQFKKLRILNCETHVEGAVISGTRFHPTSTVAAVVGVSGVASIVQVDGRENSKLVSVQFERYPVHCARFSTDGSELLVGSKCHPHFFSYDLLEGRITKININQSLEQTHTKLFEVSPCGRYIALIGRWGAVHILTSRAKEWVSTFQMTGEVASLSFSSNGSQLFTYGETGEVWVWDMASRSCVHRFMDEGSFGGFCVTVSPSSRFIACGSQTGIVNLYDRDDVFKPAVSGCSKPSPIYTIGNLVTPITSLQFDPTSELLVLASANKPEAIRIAHLPSRSVYCNFPGFNSKLNKPLCMDISPHGGYLSLGDNKGNAHLIRLCHFGNY